MKKRFTEEQIIGILKEQEAGFLAKEIIRRHGIAEREPEVQPNSVLDNLWRESMAAIIDRLKRIWSDKADLRQSGVF